MGSGDRCPVEALLRERLPASGVDHDPLDLDGPGRGDEQGGQWRTFFDPVGFGPLQHTGLTNAQTLDRDGLASFFASMGWIAEFADDERLPLLAEVRSLLTTSEYRRRWTTNVYRTHLMRH